VLVRMQRGSVQIKSQGYHFPYLLQRLFVLSGQKDV
jgi:hypothetical protein